MFRISEACRGGLAGVGSATRGLGMTAKVTGFQQQIAPLVPELYASANAHDTDRHWAIYAYREKQRRWWDDGKAVGV
jgi:hypothetical protein